jgi:hypothetical protein
MNTLKKIAAALITPLALASTAHAADRIALPSRSDLEPAS